MILGALATLVVCGCGKGLYTRAGQFHDHDGSEAGSGTGGGGGGGAGGGGTGASGGTGGSVSTSPNAGATADASPVQTSDAAPKLDVAPGSEITKNVSGETRTEILLGGATLTFLKGTFPPEPHPVTLSLVSNDGTPPRPGYGGAIGPVFSITTDFNLWDGATLKIRFTPDPAIPPSRIGLAYVDLASKVWVLITTPIPSSYDANTNEVTGTVAGFSGMRYFAPVEICGQDAGACHLFPNCKAEACQE
jgi:hypothetical protein